MGGGGGGQRSVMHGLSMAQFMSIVGGDCPTDVGVR